MSLTPTPKIPLEAANTYAEKGPSGIVYLIWNSNRSYFIELHKEDLETLAEMFK